MNPCINIRLAVPEDAQAIHDLHTASVRALCSKVYPTEVIEGWLKGRTPKGYQGICKGEMYIIENHSRIAGFSHVVPGEIVAIFIHPDFIRQKLGSLLLQHAKEIAGKNWQGPIKIDSTLNAEPFYASQGFTRIGVDQAKRNGVSIAIIRMETIS